MKFEGIYTPVITPYRDDASIDYERLGETVDFLIDAGVHGIISAGTTGEYYAQTMDERIELMKFIQQKINGRSQYIVGTGAFRTEESIEYAKAAVAVGADALLVATPPYSIPTERENALHALAIDQAANLPILLYNYPARMGAMMPLMAVLEQGGKFIQCVKHAMSARGLPAGPHIMFERSDRAKVMQGAA